MTDENFTPVTPEEALAMARAAGLRLPRERADAVAQRLTWVKAEAGSLRDEGFDDVPPFSHFDFPLPTAGPSDTPPTSATPGHSPTDAAEPARPTDLTTLDVATLATAFQRRALSPVEVTEAYLARIERWNPTLRAYITVAAERALADAARAEKELRAGVYRGPLHGIPIAHKDLLATRGIRTTYHTHAYQDYVPEQDAPVVRQLDEAGAVLLGKANTFELGSGDGDVFGLAVNPWNPERQTGGSSSGSAVAVAAGLAAAATGTDAGGSIRVPAAFCGVVGLKPTAGVLPAEPAASAISVAGPMTRTATDAAILFEAMVRHDTHECLKKHYRNLAGRIEDGVAGLRVGLPVDWLDAPQEDEVRAAVQQAVRTVITAGAVLREVHLPHAASSEVMGSLITHVDCFSKYRPLLENGAQLGSFVRELLTAGQLYSATDYLLAQRLRTRLMGELKAAHEQADVLIAPVVPYGAARLGESRVRLGETETNPRTGMGRFTRLSNLTGHPSISVPTSMNGQGMPLAVQVLGRPYDEAILLRVARVLERANPYHDARPPATSDEHQPSRSTTP